MANADFTEFANAQRFVELHCNNVRWCGPWEKWMIWDQMRWKVDDMAVIEKYAKGTITVLLLDALQKDRQDQALWAIKSMKRSMMTDMLTLARSDVAIHYDKLDKDPYLFNVTNGTIDLRTGKLRTPHSKEDFITKLSPIEFDPDALCPTWDSFLHKMLGGDEHLLTYMRRAVGLTMIGTVLDNVLFFLHGNGDNGKSTFVQALLDVMGDYGKKIPNKLLMVSKNDRHPTEIADLFGARFVASGEIEAGDRFAEAQIKDLTGEKRLSARRMREDPWQFDVSHTLWIMGNHKPNVLGTDNGIWRRIKLVPWTVKIKPEEKDLHLGEKLKAELPGILAWAVRGCLEWQEKGLEAPRIVLEATEAYREDMDRLADFIAEKCYVGENAKAWASDLYDEYTGWVKGQPMTLQSFGEAMTERGFPAVRSTAGRKRRIGIGLLADHVAPAAAAGAGQKTSPPSRLDGGGSQAKSDQVNTSDGKIGIPLDERARGLIPEIASPVVTGHSPRWLVHDEISRPCPPEN